MNIVSPPKIVLLGMMSHMPFAGVLWQTLHYLVGLQRLGFEMFYVEAHAMTPKQLMQGANDNSSLRAISFLRQLLERFDLKDHWAFHALHDDGQCFGMTKNQLEDLYRSAALIINLHGGTEYLPDHVPSERLVYLETDPVAPQIELYDKNSKTVEFLARHGSFFTFGENYGRPDCKLPVSDRFHFQPTRQPVVMEYWQLLDTGLDRPTFTTIANWRQDRRDIQFQGETYHWSKHYEFLKFLDLPARTGQAFELALSASSCNEDERALLQSRGWKVSDALTFSRDLDPYRQYIIQSRGEFTVAKDQNVRLRSGWFSDRAATYLAAGRPVITQETAFSNILPTGEGLFAFSTLDQAITAVEAINSNYEKHCRAAREIAREYFSYDKVLTKLLAGLGLGNQDRGGEASHCAAAEPFPTSLVLSPTSRWPTQLPQETIGFVLAKPLPTEAPLGWPIHTNDAFISIIIVTFNQLIYTRLCLETLLANTKAPAHEIIVVDNGSTDDTLSYLLEMMRRHPRLRVLFNESNRGFAAANNQGLSVATGDILVLLNNDTLVPPGWLARLTRPLADATIGMIGPVTNRTGNEAQIETNYRTFGEMLRFAADHTQAHEGESFDLRMLAMYCVALRRDVFQRVGPLDERFEMGLFEDDDYAMRVRAAGYRIICAEDIFVHHFGQASLGHLAVDGSYGRLFHANRQRWEDKWFLDWQPHRRRRPPPYEQLVEQVRQTVESHLSAEATIVVVSKGDDALLDLNGRRAWHFPRTANGAYAGHYPADSAEAIGQLENLRDAGADFLLIPHTSLWWLDHYRDFQEHLEAHYPRLVNERDIAVIYALTVRANLPTPMKSNGQAASKVGP